VLIRLSFSLTFFIVLSRYEFAAFFFWGIVRATAVFFGNLSSPFHPSSLLPRVDVFGVYAGARMLFSFFHNVLGVEGGLHSFMADA
jgi:hypothetical protein